MFFYLREIFALLAFKQPTRRNNAKGASFLVVLMFISNWSLARSHSPGSHGIVQAIACDRFGGSPIVFHLFLPHYEVIIQIARYVDDVPIGFDKATPLSVDDRPP
jgi:hypothetical protein